jgi:hypothetical protein
VAQLCVAALDKGWAIAGEPRLDLSHACSPECINIYGLVSSSGWRNWSPGIVSMEMVSTTTNKVNLHCCSMGPDERAGRTRINSFQRQRRKALCTI